MVVRNEKLIFSGGVNQWWIDDNAGGPGSRFEQNSFFGLPVFALFVSGQSNASVTIYPDNIHLGPGSTAVDSKIVRVGVGLLEVQGGARSWKAINADVQITKTASFGPTLGEANVYEINAAGATTATLPLNSTQAVPIGTRLTIRQTGAGACTIAGAGGVTLNIPAGSTAVTWGSYTEVAVQKTATDTWSLIKYQAPPLAAGSGISTSTSSGVTTISVPSGGITSAMLAFPRTYAIKTGDTTRNNTVATADDPDLTLALTAGTYKIQAQVYAVGDSTADIKFRLNAPASATGYVGMTGPVTTYASGSGQVVQKRQTFGSAQGFGCETGNSAVFNFTSIMTVTTSGNAVIGWAQTTATVADTTVQIGSFIEAIRIA